MNKEPDQEPQEGLNLKWLVLHRSPWGKFVKYTVAYLGFLSLATHVGIYYFAEFDEHSVTERISRSEVILLTWIIAHGIDAFSTVLKLGWQECLIRGEYWHVMDVITAPFPILTMLWRYKVSTELEVEQIRAAYGICIILFYARSLRFLAVHHQLGPLLTSLFTMFTDVFAWLVMALTTISAFAVAFLVVMKHTLENSDVTFNTLADAWYFTIGLVLDPEYSEDAFRLNATGWILFRLYNVLMSIMLLNLLIAMMASSYAAIIDNVQHEFRFAFVGLLREFTVRSTIPPPFSPLVMMWGWIWSLGDMCCRQSTVRADANNRSRAAAVLTRRNIDEQRRRVQKAEKKAQKVYLRAKEEVPISTLPSLKANTNPTRGA
ncbi:hypothetical protein CYMTET_28544 [Cymbomonas tetramitiformis]|uniref:Ion transport domain-containing protein n=1 Tax=Cymbomonas tetramitiformis TaxID=36881 RepID=A0AAE0FP62_9CHLO|nr:hypothetical protein CYMTET_28544 [Cymbomonas tetramitiformis]